MNRTMASAELTLLIVVALELMLSEVDGQKACSCYTFENGGSNRMTWPQARMACGFNNKYLVVMDTTQEWEFINKAIRNRTGVPNNEWHIGLWKNRTTGQWTWINGKRLTIAKWQRDKPQQNDFYAVIYKGFSCSTYGSFDSVQGDTRRGWICEEETDSCQGVCMHRHPSPTSSAPPKPNPPSATDQDQAHSSDGQKTCSCYTFVDAKPYGKSWLAAKQSCEYDNKHLVVMETEKEWEFINKSIEARRAVRYNEWHIGLWKDKTTGNWTWINGKPLTIKKWQKNKPDKGLVNTYALIAKEYPPGSYGLFNNVHNGIFRGWICERETGNCTGVCMRHKPATRTTVPPQQPYSSSTESIKLASTTGGQAYSPDNCQGVCMHRPPSSSSTAPPKPTPPSATEDQAHSSG